jgi:formylglycine-generating enzyme required for sulfatase activity
MLRKWQLVWLAAAGFGLSLAGSIVCAEEPGQRLALLVGIDKYPSGSGFASLPFPQRDVDALAKVLRDSHYRPEHVRVMTREQGSQDDPRFLPIGQNILAEFRLLARDRKPEDTVLVALIGHGITRTVKVKDAKGNKLKDTDGNDIEKSVAFFCPMNADIRDTNSMISLDELYSELEACKAGVKLMLVDACRDNPTEGNTGAIPFAPPRVPASVAALFSCSDGEVAWEDSNLGGGHGVFLHFVIEGLKGSADRDHDQKISLLELAEFTQEKVSDFVSNRRGRRQMPVLLGRSGRVTLVDLARDGNPRTITNSIGMTLNLIQPRKFLMGSDATDPDGYYPEFLDNAAGRKEKHLVRITKPFYLGIHEVTRGQFRRFVDDTAYRTEAETDGKGGHGWNEQAKKIERNPRYNWRNPGFEQTDEHPVVNVSWNDAQKFAAWLSRKERITYRLPTEAEWEYACRARTTSPYSCGKDPEALAAFGNIADGTAKEKRGWFWAIAARDGYVYTAPVGRFHPNCWGLYDMHGNVEEWCADWYGDEYYKQSPVDDPPGPDRGSLRVKRGGGWISKPDDARSACRGANAPAYRRSDLGFRLARVQSGR